MFCLDIGPLSWVSIATEEMFRLCVLKANETHTKTVRESYLNILFLH